MLKGVKKGIKKKIKGKKSKKEDDLFDPEQLEKYKRELEEAKKAQQEDESSCGAAGGSSAGHEEDEEWLRFKQLTSGVDAVVNKVSEDLDRIKESSFFQRNKPSEQNKLFASERPAGAIIPTPEQEIAPVASPGQWFNPAREFGHESDDDKEVGDWALRGEDTSDDPFSAVVKFPESDDIEPVELEDSLFDTTFLDAIASGEIKLAYIPDSPTHEDEDDPFDTTAVEDVVKRIEEEEEKQKKQVNLGMTVEFLTGKSEKTAIERPRVKAAETKAKARPRPHAVNLLGDFDSAPIPVTQSVGSKTTAELPKDIFDQILGSPSKDLAFPLAEKIDLIPGKATEESKTGKAVLSPKEEIKNVISEFDIISQLDPISGSSELEILVGKLPSSIPSSIAALLTTTAPTEPEEDELDDEFAALAAESIHKGPSPASLVDEVKPKEEPVEDEEDPFDTSYVEKTAAHGKCELKILENEILGGVQSEKEKPAEEEDDDFNPRFGESPPNTLQIQNAPKINPLEDFSPSVVRAPTIEPHVRAGGPTLVDTVDGGAEGNVIEELDPFDTSRLESALPGKVELKLLEAELLSSVEAKVEPRQLPEKIASAFTNPQLTPDDGFDFNPRKDEVKHHPLDLPDIGFGNTDTASKVLTPLQDMDVEIDPFDTSAVSASGLIPGPLELKLLESEFVSPSVESPPSVHKSATRPHPSAKMTRAFSDEDFDPRGGVPAPAMASKPTEDIFDSAMDFAVDKPLTPQQESAPTGVPEPTLCSINVDDPFDTSGIQIENYLAKSELKQVEEELLNAPHEPKRVLPVIVGVELKKPQRPAIPEPQPEPSPQHLLEAMTHEEDDFKPLTPVEVLSAMSGVISVFNPSPMSDPFDTSIAEGVIPGKTEIKLLEEELGVAAGLTKSFSDDDFNPRAPNHPSHQMASQPLIPMSQSQMKSSPVVPIGEADADPFDTSSTETGIPGKAELKALEAELL